MGKSLNHYVLQHYAATYAGTLSKMHSLLSLPCSVHGKQFRQLLHIFDIKLKFALLVDNFGTQILLLYTFFVH